MKRNDYITIQAYMVTELGLSGNNLIIYALIHGFCKDGIHEFKGSINYICEWTNLTRNTVIAILKQLVESELLIKRTYKENNVTFCAYSLGSAKITPPVQNVDEGSEKIAPNNNIDNTKWKKDKEESLSKSASDVELFEKCWITYRRKGKKGKSLLYWKKLTESEKQMVLPHIKAYVTSRELQFQQDFERYLKDKAFLSIVFKGNQTIYDPTKIGKGDSANNVYTPSGNFSLMWDEPSNAYMYIGYYYDGMEVADGYTNDNRPNGAKIILNNARGTIIWNSFTKKWEHDRT